MTESEKESMILMHMSVMNAHVYAEDLLKHGRREIRESMAPIENKLRWIKTALKLKVPDHKRAMLDRIDTLQFDEILRLLCRIDDLNSIEQFVKQTYESQRINREAESA